MFAMSGAKVAHIRIVANMMRELGTQLTGRPYEPLSNDMRVCVKPTGLYTYPDVVVVCGELEFLDDTLDTLLNPKIIIEIPSDSGAYDRGKKFELYRSLESLSEYVLISSRGVSVERYTREPNGTWIYSAKGSLADTIELSSIDCRLLLSGVYERVEFEPPSTV